MDVLPFPTEMLTLGVATITGLWGAKMKAQLAYNEMMLRAATQHSDAVQDAREHGIKDKHFSFTRRVIALAIVFSVVVWPKLVPVLFKDVPVTVGWTQWNPGFLFFDGKEETVWQTVEGLALTPLDTHLAVAVIGLYFGTRIIKLAGR